MKVSFKNSGFFRLSYLERVVSDGIFIFVLLSYMSLFFADGHFSMEAQEVSE